MSSLLSRIFLGAAILSAPPALAGETLSPLGHAPAGIMGDHMHGADEFMIGYRYMYGNDSGAILHGDNEVTDAQLVAPGFSMIPTEMRMSMHMLDLMYAPADWLTLMAMPQYMSMDMTMRPLAGATGGGHGGHGGGATGAHAHGTKGIGDTIFSALLRLYQTEGWRLHVGIGFSAPTGSVTKKGADGRFTHYMMQLGSGTWDFLPSLTYTGGEGAWRWGTQANAVIRMERSNESGYRLGDALDVSFWGARSLADWLSLSARLAYRTQDDIAGHYNGPHNHASPPDLQANYGGRFLEAGLGFNVVFGEHRFGVEWMQPVYQDPNGYQQKRSGMLYAGWSLAFE